MSGFLNNPHQQHKERREEHREAHHRHGHGGRQDEYDEYDANRGQRRYDDDAQSYPSGQGYNQGQRRPAGDYAPPSGPPAFASQGGLDRADFASDAEIDRMVSKGEFGGRQRYEDAPSGRGNDYGRYDAPSGPPPGREYGERTNDYGRYDAPTGPPPGRGYQREPDQGYGSGGTGFDRQNQYGSQQAQDRPHYNEAPYAGSGRSQGNAPSGGFSASRDEREQYGSGYGGPANDRSEPPRRGESASYYNQQDRSGQGDRYAHLAGIAQEHGDDDPDVYHRATQGLHDRIQTQAQSRQSDRDDLQSHVDAHRKAYGGDDHGPMDTDTIGAAAAMEAFKQTAAAPAGGFKAGSSKPGRATGEEEEAEEEEGTATRASGSGGMQDKLMALAMSHAGKLFDQKNAGASQNTDTSQGKAQAMQSAAASAMQLFSQYQTKGKLDSGDMSKVMGLAMNLF